MNFDPIDIQVFSKMVPRSIAQDIVGVQPMDPELLTGLMKFTSQPTSYKQGQLIHQFGVGWLRYHGTEFISEELYEQLTKQES
jgi:hypothetical protein